MPFIKNQISRQRLKRTIEDGLVPTLGPSNDHTDGTWINSDIYPGEFYWNMDDKKLWLGYDNGVTSGVQQIYPSTGPGGTYTADNGLTENPANNFQLGGSLLADTTIDGASEAYSLGLDQLYAFYINAQQKALFTTNDGTQNNSFELYPQSNYTKWSYDDGSGGLTEIEMTGSKMYIRTPGFASATNGDVLTLIDNTNGKVEFQTGGGGGCCDLESTMAQGVTLSNPYTINSGGNNFGVETSSATQTYSDINGGTIQMITYNSTLDEYSYTQALSTQATMASQNTTAGEQCYVRVQPNAFYLYTPLVDTAVATNGMVLTLVDQTNGQADFKPSPGTSSSACITDFYVTNVHGCSPIRMKDPVVCESGITSTTISATTYYNLPSATFNGGSVSGATQFTGGLTANTISATTYLNLPSVSFTGGSVSGATKFTGGLTANTISATTYLNLPTYPTQGITGITASNGLSASTSNNVTTISNTQVQGITGITASTGLSANTSNNITTIINTQVQGITGITATSGISASTSNNVVTLSAVGNTGNYFRKTNAIRTGNITGGVAEVKLYSILVPANTITAGSVIYINGRYQKGATANGACTARWYFNTSDAIGGTQVMARLNGATNQSMTHERRLSVETTSTARFFGPLTTTTLDTDTTTNNGAFINGTINWSVDQYLIFTIQPAGASDVFNGLHLKLEVDLYNP